MLDGAACECASDLWICVREHGADGQQYLRCRQRGGPCKAHKSEESREQLVSDGGREQTAARKWAVRGRTVVLQNVEADGTGAVNIAV